MSLLRRWVARILLASTAALIALILIGVLLANLVFLPRMLGTIEQQISGTVEVSASFSRARYLPFRGLSLYEVALSLESGVVLETERIQIRFPLNSLPALRKGNIPSLRITDMSPSVGTAATIVSQIVDAHLMANEVVFHGVSMSLDRDGTTGIALILDSLHITHEGSQSSVNLSVAGSDITDVNGLITLNYVSQNVFAAVDIRELEMERVSRATGKLSTRIEAFSEFAGRYVFRGDMSVTDLSLVVPMIADTPLAVESLSYRYQATFDPAMQTPTLLMQALPSSRDAVTGSLYFSEGSFRVNQVDTTILPAVHGFDWGGIKGQGLAQITLSMPDVPAQNIVESLPEALSGPLASTQLNGSVSYKLNLDIPLNDISALSWRAETKASGFSVSVIPEQTNPYKLNGAFIHTIRDREIGYERTVAIPEARPASMEWMLAHSEHSERWVRNSRKADEAILQSRSPVQLIADDNQRDSPDPDFRYIYLDDMSAWIVPSILTAEDGDFFFYGGVNWITLIDAVERNIEAGEVLYGASTISMQLAKMLFLDQRRIFSRKLQEVFLVYLMEHVVPVAKDRILELYINLAEFGPGVFGIHDAARYYFGKGPEELTAGEAAWLATIMPAPKYFHEQFEDGQISGESYLRMKGLYDIMLERGRMTQQEYVEAVSERPQFAVATEWVTLHRWITSPNRTDAEFSVDGTKVQGWFYVPEDHDEAVSAESRIRVAQNLGDRCTMRSYPVGHFDIYLGANYDAAAAEMKYFLEELPTQTGNSSEARADR